MQMATTLIPKYQRKFKPISKPQNATPSAPGIVFLLMSEIAAEVRPDSVRRAMQKVSRGASAAAKISPL